MLLLAFKRKYRPNARLSQTQQLAGPDICMQPGWAVTVFHRLVD